MSRELIIPALGESIFEVQIAQWRKGEGQPVAKDEPLVELESDKATVDLPAPAAGIVSQILKREGQTAQVGEVIGYLDDTPAPTPAAEALAAPAADTTATPPETPPVAGLVAPPEAAPAPPTETAVAANAPAAAPAADAVDSGRQERRTPMSPLRRHIAERLVQAQQTAALLTTFNEIDMSAVIALRHKHREAFQERHGVKLGFMSFFVKAVIEGLKSCPAINAEIQEEDIVYRAYYDIGVAVSGGKGLVVPVLRNAERLSFAEIERAIDDLARRARENRLTLAELQGGTFTISNGGVYGSLLSTPIVNPPQSGVLGMHAIQDRPVAREGQVLIRPMMYVALTYDHRLVDGREAVGFLRRIKELVEEPARMLIEA